MSRRAPRFNSTSVATSSNKLTGIPFNKAARLRKLAWKSNSPCMARSVMAATCSPIPYLTANSSITSWVMRVESISNATKRRLRRNTVSSCKEKSKSSFKDCCIKLWRNSSTASTLPLMRISTQKISPRSSLCESPRSVSRRIVSMLSAKWWVWVAVAWSAAAPSPFVKMVRIKRFWPDAASHLLYWSWLTSVTRSSEPTPSACSLSFATNCSHSLSETFTSNPKAKSEWITAWPISNTRAPYCSKVPISQAIKPGLSWPDTLIRIIWWSSCVISMRSFRWVICFTANAIV